MKEKKERKETYCMNDNFVIMDNFFIMTIKIQDVVYLKKYRQNFQTVQLLLKEKNIDSKKTFVKLYWILNMEKFKNKQLI